jgi:hypothetical protein
MCGGDLLNQWWLTARVNSFAPKSPYAAVTWGAWCTGSYHRPVLWESQIGESGLRSLAGHQNERQLMRANDRCLPLFAIACTGEANGPPQGTWCSCSTSFWRRPRKSVGKEKQAPVVLWCLRASDVGWTAQCLVVPCRRPLILLLLDACCSSTCLLVNNWPALARWRSC